MKTEAHWRETIKPAVQESDIILEVLDARNPLGTHNVAVEDFTRSYNSGAKLILILNKVDMVPKRVIAGWIRYFRDQNYFAFPISARYHQGLYQLLDKLRQISKRDQISILIVGYPNTGKSSLIKALTKDQKTVGISSSAGFTRVIQKVRLNNHMLLIDTPGVIPIDEINQKEIAIKACMTADKVDDPMAVVEAIFEIIPKHKFEELYSIKLEEEDTAEELIEKVGIKYGRLVAKGKVNEAEVQKLIIRDWQNNKIQYYLLPPGWNKSENVDDRALTSDDHTILTSVGIEGPDEFKVGPTKADKEKIKKFYN